MPNVFIFDNFFKKSNIFRENCENPFWSTIDHFFRERRRLVPEINVRNVFYYKLGTEYFIIRQFFQKILYLFSEKITKNRFGGAQVPFEAKEHVWRRKWTQPLLWEMRFWIIFYLTISFKKSNIFREHGENNFLGDTSIFKEKGSSYVKK